MMENQLVLRRRQLIALLLALIVGLFLFEPWSLFSKPIWEQAPSSESVGKGEQIFAANCAACHGEKAVGENLQRPLGGTKDQGGYLAPLSTEPVTLGIILMKYCLELFRKVRLRKIPQ